jgi:hypothetical protein
MKLVTKQICFDFVELQLELKNKPTDTSKDIYSSGVSSQMVKSWSSKKTESQEKIYEK